MGTSGVAARRHVLRALPSKRQHHGERAGHGLVREGSALVKLQAMLGIEGRRLGEKGELPLPVRVDDCARHFAFEREGGVHREGNRFRLDQQSTSICVRIERLALLKSDELRHTHHGPVVRLNRLFVQRLRE